MSSDSASNLDGHTFTSSNSMTYNKKLIFGSEKDIARMMGVTRFFSVQLGPALGSSMRGYSCIKPIYKRIAKRK
jgi:hypothetical protein